MRQKYWNSNHQQTHELCKKLNVGRTVLNALTLFTACNTWDKHLRSQPWMHTAPLKAQPVPDLCICMSDDVTENPIIIDGITCLCLRSFPSTSQCKAGRDLDEERKTSLCHALNQWVCAIYSSKWHKGKKWKIWISSHREPRTGQIYF